MLPEHADHAAELGIGLAVTVETPRGIVILNTPTNVDQWPTTRQAAFGPLAFDWLTAFGDWIVDPIDGLRANGLLIGRACRVFGWAFSCHWAVVLDAYRCGRARRAMPSLAETMEVEPDGSGRQMVWPVHRATHARGFAALLHQAPELAPMLDGLVRQRGREVALELGRRLVATDQADPVRRLVAAAGQVHDQDRQLDADSLVEQAA